MTVVPVTKEEFDSLRGFISDGSISPLVAFCRQAAVEIIESGEALVKVVDFPVNEKTGKGFSLPYIVSTLTHRLYREAKKRKLLDGVETNRYEKEQMYRRLYSVKTVRGDVYVLKNRIEEM